MVNWGYWCEEDPSGADGGGDILYFDHDLLSGSMIVQAQSSLVALSANYTAWTYLQQQSRPRPLQSRLDPLKSMPSLAHPQ